MFREPLWLLALLLAPLHLLAQRVGAARRKAFSAALGDPALLARLLPAESARLRRARAWLEAAALALAAVALAGPQWGVELTTTEARTQQVVVAVDTSLSMLAEDVKPSRMEKAKRQLSLLLDGLRGQRVGIVAFAGQAAVVCPLTTDLDAAKDILRDVEPGMVPVPGTAIGAALRLSAEALERYPGAKSVVLLTDGEDHRSDPEGAAREAAKRGVRVFTVGIGSPEGEPIPIKDSSGTLAGYKKDAKGKTVVSRLGEAALTRMASETGGAYYRASPGGDEMLEIAERIQKGPGGPGVGSSSQQYRNRYLIPLGLSLLLLLASLLVPETTAASPGPAAARRAAAAALMILAALAAAPAARAATGESSLRRGNREYRRESYAPALESYEDAGRRRPRDPRPVFNAGDALYRLGELERAGEAFRAVAESNQPAALRAGAYYNLGNTEFERGRFKEAAEDYRSSLKLEPRDADARHNLAVALRRLKGPPPQPKGGGGGAPPPPKPEKDRPQGRSPQQQPQQQQRQQSRPQDALSKEDAQRLLKAVEEREKAAKRQIQKAPPPKPATGEEDW